VLPGATGSPSTVTSIGACFAGAGTIGPVLGAGARRVVVVRAIADAADPEAAARALRAAVNGARRG